MRILISDIVTGNVGDAAILVGAMRILERAFDGDPVEFVISDNRPHLVRKYFPEWSVRGWPSQHRELRFRGKRLLPKILRDCFDVVNERRLLFAAWLLGRRFNRTARFLLTRSEYHDLRGYAEAEVLVGAGGTYHGGEHDSWPRIFNYRIAQAVGRPMLLMTQSIEPLANCDRTMTDQLVRQFNRMRLILVRGAESREVLRSAGVTNGNVRVAGDAAWVLSSRQNLNEWTDKRKKLLKHAFHLGIAVREWAWCRCAERSREADAYLSRMAEVAIHAIRTYGAKVTFLSTSQGMSEYWTDDAQVAERVVKLIPEDCREQITVDSEFRPPMELADAFGQFDLVVTTRMHGAILALGQGVPALGIGYQVKMIELFSKLGAANWVCPFNELLEDGICGRLDRMIESVDELMPQVAHGVCNEEASAWDAAGLIRESTSEGAAIAASVSGVASGATA